jgi:hypothetical protein
VDFAHSRIGSRAADGRFPLPPGPATLDALRSARARFFERRPGESTREPVCETRSGEHSTLAATEVLRPALAQWLHEHGIRRLVDAGCGDFNWMRMVALDGLALYVGYDIVPEIIARNQQLYGDRRGHLFALGDIARTPIAACDAIVCRNVLEGLSEADRTRALHNFRASGARWLLATVPADGDWPPPAAMLPDCAGTGLGVWRLEWDDLPRWRIYMDG